MLKLEWNVYLNYPNKQVISAYNVFNHDGFMKDLTELFKTPELNFELFNNKLLSIVHYWFSSRCEMEVIISEWPQIDINNSVNRKPVELKASVYDQLNLNWNKFSTYTWESFDK